MKNHIKGDAVVINSVRYSIVEEKYALNNSYRISYGIAAYSDEKSDGTATIVASVRDISSDKEEVERLAELCNRLELSPIHLSDAVNDFLSV